MKHSIIKLMLAMFVAGSLAGCATTGEGAGGSGTGPSFEQVGRVGIGMLENSGRKLQPDHERRKSNFLDYLNMVDKIN